MKVPTTLRNGHGHAQGRTNGSWPVHEVGRNAEYFDAEASPLLSAGSQF